MEFLVEQKFKVGWTKLLGVMYQVCAKFVDLVEQILLLVVPKCLGLVEPGLLELVLRKNFRFGQPCSPS